MVEAGRRSLGTIAAAGGEGPAPAVHRAPPGPPERDPGCVHLDDVVGHSSCSLPPPRLHRPTAHQRHGDGHPTAGLRGEGQTSSFLLSTSWSGSTAAPSQRRRRVFSPQGDCGSVRSCAVLSRTRKRTTAPSQMVQLPDPRRRAPAIAHARHGSSTSTTRPGIPAPSSHQAGRRPACPPPPHQPIAPTQWCCSGRHRAVCAPRPGSYWDQPPCPLAPSTHRCHWDRQDSAPPTWQQMVSAPLAAPRQP